MLREIRIVLIATMLFFAPVLAFQKEDVRVVLEEAKEQRTVDVVKKCTDVNRLYDSDRGYFDDDLRMFPEPGVAHEKQIGKGAFGVVFATSRRGAQLAVKVMSKASGRLRAIGDELYYWLLFHQRFPTDALPFFGCFQDGKRVYLVSQRMRGSLFELAKTKIHSRALPSKSIHGILLRISEIMVHLSLCDIVHHDVKAENFLYELEQGREKEFDIRIADFGFAQSVENQKVYRGTAWFMSPEKFLFEDVTPKSDVYSLGVTFWELLARKPAIERKCYDPENFGPDCYVDIIFGMQGFFLSEYNFSLLDDDHKFQDSQNVADMIFNMMAYEAASRPDFSEVVAQLKRIGAESFDVKFDPGAGGNAETLF